VSGPGVGGPRVGGPGVGGPGGLGGPPASAAARWEVADPDAMARLGERLAGVLRAGDLVLLTGPLGAGKTTLAAGIGRGLGVRGRVTSPTFVIAREHPPLGGGPPLVHVDAYRLGGVEEVEGLDLESSLDEAVTLVEWGTGLVEDLVSDRLEVVITRSEGLDATGDLDGAAPRVVTATGHGRRWDGVDLQPLAGAAGTGP
jgi:tRNA threonylcarbamoyladenosine biosynthesis protein TsaE